MNTAERQTFSDLLSRPGMDEALMGMMRSFSQVIAASSEKEKKTGKGTGERREGCPKGGNGRL